MTRIKTILKYIDSTDLVADIGCDQALLSKELAKKGIPSIASDISNNVISRAKESIPLELKKYITFKIANGLESIKVNEANTIVLAGMGTHTIIDIISSCSLKFKKIITISNNHHYELRKKFSELNYMIYCEEIIKEKGKYYNLILFIPGKKDYNLEQLMFGVNHQNIEMFKEKNEKYVKKLKSIINHVPIIRKKEIEKQIKIVSKINY